MEPIEIPLSRKKMLLLLLGCIVFVALGFWFAISPPDVDDYIWGNPVVSFWFAVFFIVFFSVAGVAFIRKLLNKAPGMIIDETGIVDNSSGASGGRILWKEIKEFSTATVYTQRFIVVRFKDPQEYLSRQTGIKRRMMQLNYKTYNAPVAINVNTLKISFKELNDMLLRNFNTFRESLAAKR